MGKNITPGQIGELIDIDRKRGGIRAEVQELIRCLTHGVVAKYDDTRFEQAMRLWVKEFGRELKVLQTDLRGTQFKTYPMSFGEYLRTIPEIPEELEAHDESFPLLVLVDARVGVTRSCELLGIEYTGDDKTFEDFDPKKSRTEKVYWIRAQDGKKNRGKSFSACRTEFAKDELGLTVHEGLALFAQAPKTFRNWGMDLAGSVGNGDPEYYSACLDWLRDRPELYWYDEGVEDDHGSATRRA